MNQKVIIFFFLIVMANVLNNSALKTNFYKFKPKVNKSNLKLISSFVLGQKTGLTKDIKSTFKNFGLMHLLTPSGLHLSSVLLLFKFFPKIRYTIVLILTFLSFYSASFWSMKRVLIFACLAPLKYSNQSLLILTIAISFLLGHFHKASLSFCFSFIFWGAIVFHNGSKFSLMKTLFIIQLLVSLFFNSQLSLLTAIVNPIATLLFTVSFPLMCLSLFIESLGQLIEKTILFPILKILSLIQEIDLLQMNHGYIIVILLFLTLYRFKTVLILAILVFPLNKPLRLKRMNLPSKIIALDSKENILKSTGDKVIFIDRTCTKREGRFKCKKKASRKGG